MSQQMKIILLLFNLVSAILVIIVPLVYVPQYTIAQKAAPGYGQGYTDGVNTARQTYMASKSYNPTCGFNHSDSYCLGYKAGYLFEWGKMIILH